MQSGFLKHFQNRVGIIFPTGGFRKRRPVLQVESNRFVDNLAQFGEYGSFIIAMTSTVEQSRATADKALVLVRPFNNLYVLIARAHCWASIAPLPTGERDRFGYLGVHEVPMADGSPPTSRAACPPPGTAPELRHRSAFLRRQSVRWRQEVSPKVPGWLRKAV